MKAGETIVIMSLLGTISQAAKLLKVPRIYNAIITSDKELLPSQAFPALSPVLQGIQFPHYANTLYQPLSVPITTRNSDPFIAQPKQYNRPTANELSYETYAKDTPGISWSKDNPPNDSISPKSNAAVLFRPNLDPKNNPTTNEESMPNIIPNSNFKSNTVNTKKPFYPHYDEEIGQIFNVVNYDNKKVYSASSPTSPDSNSPTTQKVASEGGPRFILSTPQEVNSLAQSDQFSNPQSSDENQDQSSFVDSSPQFNPNQFQYFNDYFKNNAPKDKSIADVPPPPLPVGRPGTQRRHENAPVNPLQLAIST